MDDPHIASPDGILASWRYPRWLTVTGVMLVVVFTATLLLPDSWHPVFVVALAAFIACVTVDVNRRRLILTPEWIVMCRPWGRSQRIPLEQATLRRGDTLEIVGKDGTVIVIPDYFGNEDSILAELRRACLARGVALPDIAVQ